jgi:hypothetical protein
MLYTIRTVGFELTTNAPKAIILPLKLCPETRVTILSEVRTQDLLLVREAL